VKIWLKTKEFFEGKFLVVRRDGSIPHWPHFVLGARDPSAPIALRAYAEHARLSGCDEEYVTSIIELADDFETYRKREGNGDPPAGPHRKDDPDVVDVMRGDDGSITVWHETHNAPK
jgi:hypothetical protein